MKHLNMKRNFFLHFFVLFGVSINMACISSNENLDLTLFRQQFNSKDKVERLKAIEQLVLEGDKGKRAITAICGLENEGNFIFDIWRFNSFDNSQRISILYDAVENNYPLAVQLLLDQGLNVEGDFFRKKPLYNAVASGYRNIAEILINNGADVNARDGYRRYTPLMIAAERGYEDIAILLLENGANVTETYESLNPETPNVIRTTLSFAKNDTIKMLLQKYGAK